MTISRCVAGFSNSAHALETARPIATGSVQPMLGFISLLIAFNAFFISIWPAIAHEIGFDFDISFANPISEKTPNLCHLAPAGPTYMEDLNEAGGVYAVMKELADIGLLHTDCMTVTGKTIGENIANAVNRNPEVIRPVDHPYSKTGGLAVLKGNLAPDGSVVKRSAVVDEMMVHEGPARVFECEEDAIAAIKGGKMILAGSAAAGRAGRTAG